MTETIDPMTTTGLASLGWDDGWTATFAECRPRLGRAPAGPGRGRPPRDLDRPRRRRGSDGVRVRAPSGSKRWPPRTSRPSATGSPSTPDGVIAAVLPRRTAFKRMAADASRLLSGLDDEQVMASNVDVALLVAGLDNDFNLRRIERYLAVAWSSEVAAGRRPQQGRSRRRRRRAGRGGRGDRPGRRDRPRLGLDRPRPGRARARTCARARPRRSSDRPASASPRSSTRCWARIARRRPPSADRFARPAHDHAPRAVRTARRRAPGGYARASASLEVLGAEAGLEAAFDEVAEIAATCRFSDCKPRERTRLRGPPRIADGRIDEDRLESFRKLQREQARVARQEDPRARAESRRTWKLIHKSVNEHMKRKYGDDR